MPWNLYMNHRAHIIFVTIDSKQNNNCFPEHSVWINKEFTENMDKPLPKEKGKWKTGVRVLNSLFASLLIMLVMEYEFFSKI